MVAENSAQLWALIRVALSPEAFYQYSFIGAVGVSVLAPLLFAFSIMTRSSAGLIGSLRGKGSDVRDAWVQLIIVAFGYGLYLGLGWAFLEIVVDVWNSFGSFSNSSRSIEAIFYGAFAHAEQQDSSLWEMAKEGASMFIFAGAEICRLGYLIISLFLKYAHAILFSILFMTGPIVIPLSLVKSFDFTKGWALGWKVVVFWPIIEVILRSMTQIPFIKVASIIEASTASSGDIKIVIFSSMIIIYCLAGAVAIMVPFFTNALVTGVGMVASAVAPMVAGALAATKLLASSTGKAGSLGGSALKSAGSAAIPIAAKSIMSSLNQKGPGVLGSALKNSSLGKGFGQLGKDLKESMSPVTKPMMDGAMNSASELGKGLGIDTKQLGKDVKSLATPSKNTGESKPNSPSPINAQSEGKPKENSIKSSTGGAMASVASAMTSTEGEGAAHETSKTSESSNRPDTSPKPKKKKAPIKTKKQLQAQRAAILNQNKKGPKKDK